MDSSSGIGGCISTFSGMRRIAPSLGPPSGPRKHARTEPENEYGHEVPTHAREKITEPVKVIAAAIAHGRRYG